VFLQDIGDGAFLDYVAQIGQSTFDPSTTPTTVLGRYANDQLFNIVAASRSTWATVLASVEFISDQLSVPCQQRLGRYERGDLAQSAAANLFRLGSQPPPLLIGQPQPFAAELFAQHPILFTKVVNHISLLLTHPSSNRNE